MFKVLECAEYDNVFIKERDESVFIKEIAYTDGNEIERMQDVFTSFLEFCKKYANDNDLDLGYTRIGSSLDEYGDDEGIDFSYDYNYVVLEAYMEKKV
jgi:hypothetical protein